MAPSAPSLGVRHVPHGRGERHLSISLGRAKWRCLAQAGMELATLRTDLPLEGVEVEQRENPDPPPSTDPGPANHIWSSVVGSCSRAAPYRHCL